MEGIIKLFIQMHIHLFCSKFRATKKQREREQEKDLSTDGSFSRGLPGVRHAT